ncbi:sensor histidine kinase [Woodsholea maritima]|uniref:sensor histidine kinase n=1 Tax=Woodsholea maritima TaxID=240237 RepID=UPI000365A2A4|nr:histidine kinase dimerization/phosphoacceptor domain -containing protein [Woodsholea maritima]
MVRRSSLRLRLQLIAVLALSLSPLVILSIAQGVIEFREEQREQTDRLYAVGATASRSFEAVLEQSVGAISALAAQPEKHLFNADWCDEALLAITAGQKVYSNAATIDHAGRVLCSALPGNDAVNVADSPWFARLRGGEDVVFSEVFFGRISHRPVMIAARRIVDEGEFAGAVVVAVDIRQALSLLRTDFLPRGTEIALSDGEANLIFQANSERAGKISALPAEALQRANDLARPVVITDDTVMSGETLLIAPLVDGDIHLVLFAPGLLGPNWTGFDIVGTVLVPVMMWILALICVGLAVDYFVLRWLTYLRRIAKLYGAGRLGLSPYRAQKAPAEVQELADTLSSMASSLEEYTNELQNLAEQRGALLKEIHHRVKNNLQVIISLLNVQIGRLKDSEGRTVLMEARGRINALALVHRTLYESDDLRVVHMKPFLEQLVRHMKEVTRVVDLSVSVEVRSEDVCFEPDQSVPTALFITEAMTNAFKYAFEGREQGHILVNLRRLEGGMLEICIQDDGVGLPESISNGTGTSLMRAFSTQLGGVFERYNGDEGGTVVSLKIPDPSVIEGTEF